MALTEILEALICPNAALPHMAVPLVSGLEFRMSGAQFVLFGRHQRVVCWEERWDRPAQRLVDNVCHGALVF